jgi:hypothetical protein
MTGRTGIVVRKLLTGLLVAVVAPTLAAPAAVAASSGQVVSHKDVDGDGQRDVVSLDKLGPHRCAVRVTTASAHSARRVLTSESNPCAWHGAAQVDSRPGAELSVVTLFGASSAWHSILTWRRGRLLVERIPENPTYRGLWAVDAAALSSAGWKRTVVHGEARMIQRAATADPQHPHHKWSGIRRVFAFRHGRWVKVSQHHERWTGQEARAFGGWHVPGLPRWS